MEVIFTITYYGNEVRARVIAGLIPGWFIYEEPETPAETVINTHYQFGGWQPSNGFTFDREFKTLSYPGDPVLHPVCCIQRTVDTVYIYPHAWVCIEKPDGNVSIARID